MKRHGTLLPRMSIEQILAHWWFDKYFAGVGGESESSSGLVTIARFDFDSVPDIARSCSIFGTSAHMQNTTAAESPGFASSPSSANAWHARAESGDMQSHAEPFSVQHQARKASVMLYGLVVQ